MPYTKNKLIDADDMKNRRAYSSHIHKSASIETEIVCERCAIIIYSLSDRYWHAIEINVETT